MIIMIVVKVAESCLVQSGSKILRSFKLPIPNCSIFEVETGLRDSNLTI